jgi:dTDP-4-amino-4,6-dideoxygalactose transaminase
MDFKIPLFDLNFDEKEQNAVLETLKSKWISTGPKVAAFESKFAEMLRVKHAVALSNCTVALHLAMILCGVKADDEVICPSLTFAATANAIKYVNAKPIFCDVYGPHNLTMNHELIEGLITSKTKAIVVMHYAGFACNMDKIMELAQKHNLKVIEDACHGPLSEYKNKKLGTIGDVGCFSFFSNKNISTGEGGMLVTNNSLYYEKTKLLRSHGMTSMSFERSKGHSTTYDVVELGYNYRMDDIHASIGLVQLDKITDDLIKRIELRKYYLQKLAKFSSHIIIPFADNMEFSSNYIFPVVLNNGNVGKRDLFRDYLLQHGVQTSVHYPAVHKFSIYKSNDIKLPQTDYATDNEITLPFYGKLTFNEIDYICELIEKYFNG